MPKGRGRMKTSYVLLLLGNAVGNLHELLQWDPVRVKADGNESAIVEPFANLELVSKKLPPCERRLRLTNQTIQPQVVPRAPPNEKQYIWDIVRLLCTTRLSC